MTRPAPNLRSLQGRYPRGIGDSMRLPPGAELRMAVRAIREIAVTGVQLAGLVVASVAAKCLVMVVTAWDRKAS